MVAQNWRCLVDLISIRLGTDGSTWRFHSAATCGKRVQKKRREKEKEDLGRSKRFRAFRGDGRFVSGASGGTRRASGPKGSDGASVFVSSATFNERQSVSPAHDAPAKLDALRDAHRGRASLRSDATPVFIGLPSVTTAQPDGNRLIT